MTLVDRAGRLGRAWLLLSLSLFLHALDETLGGYLYFFESRAQASRFLPGFGFGVWASLLALLCLSMFLLTPLATRRARGMVVFAPIMASLLGLNGTAHIAGWLWWGWPASGVYTAPLLLLSSVYVFVAAFGRDSR